MKVALSNKKKQMSTVGIEINKNLNAKNFVKKKARMGSWKDTTNEQKNVMSCVRLAAKLMIITGVNGFFKVEKRLILAITFSTSMG